MKYEFFIGLDVSKEKFDVCILKQDQQQYISWYVNSPAGVRKMLNDIKAIPGYNLQNSLFCMEHTGIYCGHLLKVLYGCDAAIWVEAPYKVKQVNRYQRGKSDSLDAQNIALYAYKNRNDASLWEPARPELQKLRSLFNTRKRLIDQKKQLLTPLKEAENYVETSLHRMESKLIKPVVAAITASLKEIDRQIKELIKTDETIHNQYLLLTSVDGVGMITAVFMIITTREFKSFTDPRKFACYSGVVPFPHASGKSIKGKTRVSHLANKTAKTLLHMAALSSIVHSPEMKVYYERKVNAGKHKMLVLNAVRNKLVLRMFAVIRKNKPYERMAA